MQTQSLQSQFQSQVENRIDEEIQTIRNHDHIQQIQKNSQRTYTITYHPTRTNSVYKQKKYTLKLTLPTAYPHDPPSIRFLDQVYHLNIGFSSGEVRMPVLEDDWSPFLSLNSIIESLDQILEQPDKEYALNEETLNLYQYDRQSYNKKVQENLNHLEMVLCESIDRRGSPIHPQSPIKKLNNENTKNYSLKAGKENSQILVKNLRESMEFIDEGKKFKIEEMNDDLIKKKDDLLVINKNQMVKNIKNGKIEPKQVRPQIGIQRKEEKIEAFELKLQNKNDGQRRWKNESNLQLDGGNATLQKINETINVFIEQLNELQTQMNSVKNQGVKILLKERHDAQLEMLRELMELSEDTKRKIMKKLRAEVGSM